MAITQYEDSLHHIAVRSKTYATSGALASDINVRSEYQGLLCGRVRIGIGGTLHVVYEDDSEDTITYQSGDIDAIAIKTIKADSTAEMITVYW